ncbi:MAG: hypothetical protein RRZ93_05120 [Ruthenibacterium sp.]
MAFLVTDSAAPLLMETVPALKITHFYGHALRDHVYAYLRCYVLHGDMHCCFTSFDGAPPEGARMALCLQPASGGSTLIYSVGKQVGASLTVQETNAALSELPAAQIVTGGDEQGLYWSATGILPASAFRAAFGAAPSTGAVYAGNLFAYSLDETAFGTAFPVPPGERALTQAGFDAFTIVPY